MQIPLRAIARGLLLTPVVTATACCSQFFNLSFQIQILQILLIVSTSSYTILIAEDDHRTRTALATSLRSVGYQVLAVADGQEALDSFHAAAETIDLVVLDVLMPRVDGFQVCQALRAVSDVPIIMATVLGSSSDRVTGLEMGANDYIVKPFSTKELIARIRSILRRIPKSSVKRAAHTHAQAYPLLKVGRMTIDPNSRRAYIGSHHLRLTEIEFRLLSLLASKPGHIYSRGDILQMLWGYDASSAVDTKTVDVHISRLRIKLDDPASDPKFIVTIRGRGYMFLVQR